MKFFSAVLFAVFAAALASSKWDNLPPVSDPVAFVNSIELAEPKFKLPENFRNRSLLKTPPDNKKEGYVVAGGLTAFTENVKGLSKQDILDATLFAQLASDRMYDREKDTVNWYSYYKNILGNIGFVIETFSFQQYKASGATFTMDKVVLEILAAIATGGQSAIITATLNAFRGMSSNDGRIKLFDLQSSSSSSGNFQVYPCEQAPDGEVSIALGAFYFHASEHHGNFLFFSWGSSSTNIYKGAQKAVLNSNVYARAREAISAKLGDNAVNLVASIEL